MKKKPIVRLGSLRDNETQITIPAFFIIRRAQSTQEAPVETLLVSLNLPLDQINKELEIFNRFVSPCHRADSVRRHPDCDRRH